MIIIIATPPLRDEMVPFLIVTVVILVIFLMAILLITRLIVRNNPAAGLYENGIQQTHTTFIPYKEIARTELISEGWPKKRDILLMHPRYKLKLLFGIKTKLPWSINVEFLGAEGLRELEARIRGVDGTNGPPELHLYGTYK